MSLVAVSAMTAVMVAVTRNVAVPNISLLYVPPILFSAVYFGTGPSLLAATLAVVEYDFFLLRPFFTLTIGQVQDVLAFVIFLIVAVLTSQLAAGARARADAAQRRAQDNETLYELGQALMAGHDLSTVLQLITERVRKVLSVDRCAIFMPDQQGQVRIAAQATAGRTRDREAEGAAAWAFQHEAELTIAPERDGAGRSNRLYVPLRTADRTVGVLEVGAKRSGEPLEAEEHRLVTSVAAQAALVIARAEGDIERNRREVLEQSDRLKSALLSAVSHDLRTPLASIKTAATALLLDTPPATTGAPDLLATINEEADRLNRLVGNLLDLSRIEAGVLRPVLDWYDVHDVLESILPRLRPLVHEHPLIVDVPEGIPPVYVDRLRLEELLFNLVENAVAYTPPGSPIELHVGIDEGRLDIAVVDHGPGVAPQHREKIFEQFYRGKPHSDRQPGTGLGLAICRGIAEAHGGTMTLADTAGGGATFVCSLPLAHIPAMG